MVFSPWFMLTVDTVHHALRLDLQRLMETSVAESLAEARRARRQRKVDQIEIPAERVVMSDELLGKGGFGAVYIADFNGGNAAVKVIQVPIHS